MVGRWAAVLATLVLLSASAASFAQPASTTLTGLALDGHRLDWDSLLDPNHTELLVFATTWCPTCRREASEVESWAARNAGRARVIYIFSGSEPERVAESVEAYGPDPTAVQVVVDADGAVAQQYGVTATPTLLLMDPAAEGVTAYSHIDDVPDRPELTRFTDDGEELGTSYDVVVLAPPEASERVAQDLADARALVQELGARFSEWRDDSEISLLNARAPQGPVPVADDLRALIQGSLHVAEVTGGAFDPTWKPLGALWDEAERVGHAPSPEELAETLRAIGPEHVALDGSRIAFDNRATRVGLEGVAKGWIVDAAFQLLSERGYESVIVNIGGDLRTSGRDLGDRRRLLRLVDPYDPSATAGFIEVEDTAVATSGNYFRFRDVGGEPIGHIFDPRTGRPPAFDGSATAITHDAAMADALATAFFVLGPEEGMRLAAGMDHVGVIYVTREGIVSNVQVLSE